MGQLERERGRAERFCKAYSWGTAFQMVVRQVASSASQVLRVQIQRNTKYGEITFFFYGTVSWKKQVRNLRPVKFNPSAQWVHNLSLTLVSALMHCQSPVGSDCAELSHALRIVAL